MRFKVEIRWLYALLACFADPLKRLSHDMRHFTFRAPFNSRQQGGEGGEEGVGEKAEITVDFMNYTQVIYYTTEAKI